MLTVPALALSLLLAANDELPAPAPTFSQPTQIDNPLTPITPGTTQLMLGRRDGTRASVLITHLDETRVFTWGEALVETAIMEEQEFEDGELVEIARTYLAQADDGSVYLFGEISWEYQDGAEVGPENDSWVVGPPAPSDPAGVKLTDGPAVFMPTAPQQGDSFNRSAIEGEPELLEVLGVRKLRVPAGKFVDVLVLRELPSELEPGPAGFSWYAPGVGRIAEKGPGLKVRLLASSLVQPEND